MRQPHIVRLLQHAHIAAVFHQPDFAGALVKYPRQNAMRRDNTTKEVTSELTYTEWYKAKGGTEKEQMWWAEERKRKKEAAKK